MKVLLIDVNCKHSSTGKIVYDLYTELNCRGHEVAICYGRGPLVKEENIYKFGLDIETFFHAFMTRITGLTGIYSPLSTRRLIKFIEEFKPDVVHIHELHAYFVNIVPLINYLKTKKIKTVWTFHCEFMYTGKCGHAYDCERWKEECGNCPQKRMYPASLFFDNTAKMLRIKKQIFNNFNRLTIVTPSPWLAERVQQSFLRDNEIRIIPNGIDTERIFHPKRFAHLKTKHALSDEKIVLAVAQNLMARGKGANHIMTLAKLLKNENTKFILIGGKRDKIKYDQNVIIIDRINSQDELSEYYSLADIFVICSQKETFSMTCAEALCCGTPVVGYKAGAPESIFEEPYAMFSTYGDVDGLLSNVKSQLFNNKVNKTACASYGKDKFSSVNMSSSYYLLYQEILEVKTIEEI